MRTPDATRLSELISAGGGQVTAGGAAGPGEPGWPDGADLLSVTGMEAARIGELAAAASVVLHELTPQLASLEEAFMELTAGSLEFAVRSADGNPAGDGQVSTESASTHSRSTG